MNTILDIHGFHEFMMGSMAFQQRMHTVPIIQGYFFDELNENGLSFRTY